LYFQSWKISLHSTLENWLTNQLHRAESFLRSRERSRVSQHFMEPLLSLPCSKEPSTGFYLEQRLIQSISLHSISLWQFYYYPPTFVWVLSVASYLLAFPSNPCIHFSLFLSLICVLHAMTVSPSLTPSFWLYSAKSTSYEDSHWAVFYSLLPFRLSCVQIFFSVSCCQTSSVYVIPLMPETKFHTYRKLQAKLYYIEIREYGRRDPPRWPRSTLYPQKLALTSPTSSGRSVGIGSLADSGHGV
jgi:hypothetical protein